MRQHVLNGRYNRQRYVDQYEYLPAILSVPSQIQIVSTTVDRTMQSVYSEMLGLYPPGNASASLIELSAASQANIKTIASPPFTVRNAATVNQQLGQSALPHAFVGIPAHTYVNQPIEDDLDMGGCPYPQQEDERFPEDSTYTSEWWLVEDLQGPLGECFLWDEEKRVNTTFMDIYNACDEITSRLFEPLAACDNATFVPDELMITRCN